MHCRCWKYVLFISMWFLLLKVIFGCFLLCKTFYIKILFFLLCFKSSDISTKIKINWQTLKSSQVIKHFLSLQQWKFLTDLNMEIFRDGRGIFWIPDFNPKSLTLFADKTKSSRKHRRNGWALHQCNAFTVLRLKAFWLVGNYLM